MLLTRIAAHRSKSFIALAGIALIVLARGGIGLSSSLDGWLARFAGVVMGISIIGGVGLSVILIGRIMLGPLDAAARERRGPMQFTVADFLALMVLLQLPVPIVRLLAPDPAALLGPIYLMVWIACCLMWGVSVLSLSRAGVCRPRHRLVFLLGVLPIAFFGSIAFVTAAVVCLMAACDERLRPGLNGWWLAGILILTPVAFSWAAGFVRTMLRGTAQSPKER